MSPLLRPIFFATPALIHIGLSCTISVKYFCDAVRASEGRSGRRVEVAAHGIAPDAAKGYGPAPALDDLNAGVWWDEKNGGKGNGVNINALLPINPQPLVGMQAWFDTVCSLRKV